MEFRPCIDIHNGKVKQIVGGSLTDQNDHATENFVSGEDASFYAHLYKNANIRGGHIILLNSADSPYYEADREQAFAALAEYPGGLQIGGGINASNAMEYIERGASHVIVTSYVFQNGNIQYERLEELKDVVGREHLVLDVSCKRVGEDYLVVTDRWQKLTAEKLNVALLEKLERYCDEFLIHAVDVEGKSNGIETKLVQSLQEYDGVPVTYAGGVHSYDDIEILKNCSNGRVNVTVGSALNLFGGKLDYKKILEICK